jgi:hypothetical protein
MLRSSIQSVELVISLAVNVVLLWTLIRTHLLKYLARQRLALLWGNTRGKPVVVAFSRFPIDDASRFGSERTVTHVGDAQSLPIITAMLRDRFSRQASVIMAGELVSGSDAVLIGGPAFNPATKKLLDYVHDSIALAHSFCPTNHGWSIRDLPGYADCRQLVLQDRRVTQDFAILGRVDNPDHPDDKCILLAGLSTFGTLGAVIYACNPKRIHDLFVRFPHLKNKQFTALLSVCPDDNYTGVRETSLTIISAAEVQPRAAAPAHP